MASVCSACGADVPDRYPRCGNCGTPLEASVEPPEIRRYATVVNSDLKGSTALGERLDPESLRGVLTLYFDEMRAVFESHGGTIEKIIGDAIVAVFGIPVRRDDDALRAVEAAAESQRALASLNDRLEATWGVRLVVRTGVATGDVLVGEATAGQHVLTGDTMAISSAMEQNSPPLEVLLDSSTYELVRDHVQVELHDPVTPKGRTEARTAYVLTGVETRAEDGSAGADAGADVAAGMRLCPSCGEENPDDFRHCGTCGALLPTGVTVRDTRKTVTLVFADPKPATADGRPPDPEALRDVMPRYFEAMKAALEHHGGTVEHFIGDAVMAVFGLPVRHEDDAVRAIRAAAEMQTALPALNEGFRSSWGIQIENHIGVNTGEVIAGDASLGQRLVTGDAVNTAARLEQAAGPGEIVIGGLTYRLARDQIEVEAIPPLTLKGKAEPFAAFRLVRALGPHVEQTAMTTPFVGRREEMDHLETTLLEVAATRSCELRVLIGEAGVGKSRIVREFATRATARDRAQVVRGRCLPYGDGVTFWPIGEIVRSAAGINDEDPLDIALGKIAIVARGSGRLGDETSAVADRVAAAIGLSTAQYPGPELFWGIRRLLEAIASRRPLVAIIDDIHVAAPTFLELLDHMLDAVHGSPILMLATARHELLETRGEWAESHEDEQIVLGPLSPDDADAIVEQLLGALQPDVRARILTAAEGNPLYVEQISSMLIETGALRRDGDRWIATTSSDEIAIPPTVEALVASRLDALQRGEREVIDPASVIGMGFALDAVTQLVPEVAAPDVPHRLQTLTSKQFVRPTVAEEDFFRFGHSVIKDAAYKSLLKRDRADLHERFVGWAEPVNRARGREIEFEEILGYHLEQAFRYRRELGTIDDAATEVGRRGAAKLSSAGRRALTRGDLPSAASLLQRSVDLLSDQDPERIAILPDLAESLFFGLGEAELAKTTDEDAIEAATVIGDERLAARAEVGLIMIEQLSGAVSEPLERAQRAMRVLESHDDEAGIALAWRSIASVHMKAGRYEEAASAAEETMVHAERAGDERLVLRGIAVIASMSALGPTRADEAIERSERVAVRARGDRRTEAMVAGSLAPMYAMRGSFDQARELYRRERDLLLELGPSIPASSTSIEGARVEVLAGNLDVAEQELRRDYAELLALGEMGLRATVAAMLARVLLLRGDLARATDYSTIAMDLAEEDDLDAQVRSQLVQARLLAAARDDRAIELAERAVRQSKEMSDLSLRGEALEDLAQVIETLQGTEEAEPPLREALTLFEEKGDLVSSQRVRALLDRVVA
jgi:class 3 adenylate cyclase/tetratricopeptide (TPR) repeat protein